MLINGNLRKLITTGKFSQARGRWQPILTRKKKGLGFPDKTGGE
jgi:hypothetical protein